MYVAQHGNDATTGDKIAGATGIDVKVRAERKLGGTIEKPPQSDRKTPRRRNCARRERFFVVIAEALATHRLRGAAVRTQ
jgi:hypothetical protein